MNGIAWANVFNLKLIKKSAWGFLAASIRTLGGWAVHKVFALYFGASSVGLLSHLQNFFSLFTQPLTDGSHKALIRFLSGNENGEKQEHELGAVNFTLWLWNLGFSFLLFLLVFAFFPQWLDVFDWSAAVWWGMSAVIIALIFQTYIQSIILAYKKLKAFALLSAISVVIMLLMIYYAASSLNVDQSLWVYAASQIVLALIFAFYLFYEKLQLPWKWKTNKPLNAYFLSFMLMAASIWLFTKLTDFVIRDYAMDYFGLFETGLWQACDRISQGYRALYIATLSAVFYPQISDLLNNNDRLRPYVFSVYKFIIAISTLFFAALILFNEQVLVLFYSAEFAQAAYLMQWQILGDIFSFLAFPLSMVLMAKVKTAYFISLQAISALIYIAVILIFNQMGVEIFVIAWAVRQLFYLIFNIIVNRKLIFYA